MVDGTAGGAERGDLVRAFEAARADDDVEAMAAVAVRIAADRRFGAPHAATGYLHEAYERAVAGTHHAPADPAGADLVGADPAGADPAGAGLAGAGLAVRLAVELARTWAYANEPERAAPFAQEALARADQLGDPALRAAALDADLLVHWGPDDLPARVSASSRLDSLAGRLTDVETRLSAALWRLTTALETLDVVMVRRQLQLLDDLARESSSPRVAMFAASRRGMYALLIGDLATARRLVEQTRMAGATAGEPDGEALVHVLLSGIARQAGDVAALAAEAAAYESFATEHGIRSVLAEAATLWLEAGEPRRAADLMDQVVAGGISLLPRDVDWLLTLVSATDVAIAVGALDLVQEAVDQLTPYAGRGVVNAGGVAFVGVVDDTLRTACQALSRDDDAARHAVSAATLYRRLGARWWMNRLETAASTPVRRGPAGPPSLVLAPAGPDVWLVGPPDRPVWMRATKGLRYLALLVARPHVELTALELSAAVNGARTGTQPGATPRARTGATQQDLGDTLDRRALAEYRRRLADLDAELEQAREWADQARAAELTAERGFLLDEIAAATGLHGRTRRLGGDGERARVAVQKSLSSAIRRITELDPATGRLLGDTVRTGATCCYEPDPNRPVQWLLHDQSGTARDGGPSH